MYINIIPLTKLPISKPQVYTYSAGGFDDGIKIGQIIEAQLYYRNVAGIVRDIIPKAPREDLKYKPIIKILDEHPIVGNKDLELAEFISAYYFSPLGIILKHLTAETPKRKAKKVVESMAKMNLSLINSSILTKGKRHGCNQNEGVNLIINTLSERQKEYFKIIHKTLQEKKQVLFLVPELMLIPQTLNWLEQKFPNEKIILLHSELTKSDQYINWRKAQTGSAKIFLGTRRAVLTPFYNLGHIIVDEEQSLSYKQWDMNPRFDARTVIAQKAEVYNCQLTFGTVAPSVKAYFDTQISSPPPSNGGSNANSIGLGGRQIINMRDELKKGNYSIFSEDLQAEIKKALNADGQAMLFVNRRGASTFVMCRDCGHVVRCPKCNIALMEHASKTLSCNHCNFKTNSPLACPQCRSNLIKGFGVGIEKVEQELKKIFTDIKTICVDPSNTSLLKTAKQKYQEFIDNKINVLIGTQISLPLTSPNLSLIAAVNIDSILNFPDWRTDEKSWQILNQLCRRDDVKNCIIQTYNPDNKLLQLLSQNDQNIFYSQELKNRKLLKYPPYIKMIKLICKSDDYDFLLKESERVANQLKSIPNIRVIGPVKPINEKIRNFWQRNVIIKLTDAQKNDIFKQVLTNLSNAWSIDVDPLT
ncbi:MAG: primosomal protein N' [Patescibacteria group bacterium]|jgi:primosomal protein N' (replication factor Y)